MATRLPAGMLLDLDDTILTYDAVSDDAWRRACELLGPARGLAAEALYSALAETREWYWGDDERRRLGRLRLNEARVEVTLLALRTLGRDDEALARELCDCFVQDRDAAIDFFPGALATLEHLRERGVALGLMTNGQSVHQRRKLQRFDLERFFEVVCVEGELGFGKPDSRVYTTALAGLGLAPAEVWAVGDNLECDVAGPQRLGVLGIWHDHRRAGLPAGCGVRPDRIIHSLPELLR